MIKRIISGGRCTGKTKYLLTSAVECEKNGKQPVFVHSYASELSYLKAKAERLGIDTSNWLFITYDEFQYRTVTPSAQSVFIDNAERFVSGLINRGATDLYFVESPDDYYVDNMKNS